MMMTTMVVGCCGECPFAMEPDEEDDGWWCSAVREHSEARPLGKEYAPFKARPPRWCPLRKADQLVRLGARTR